MSTTKEEFCDALEDMVAQYLRSGDRDVYTHDFMSAGENALALLEREGRMNTEDGVYYRWSPKSG